MHTKRIAAGGVKGIKWTATPKGPHKKSEAIPLVSVLRNLGYADNAREAGKILNLGKVQVDGKVRKDSSYGVGTMDVVSIPSMKKNYRVMPQKNGLILKEIGEKDAKLKPCKIIGKKTLPLGKTQIILHDGASMMTDKTASVKDTVMVELPGHKLKEILPFAVGASALVVSGRHRGVTGTIADITKGTAARKSLTTLGDMQTLTEYVLITGKDKPQVEL